MVWIQLPVSPPKTTSAVALPHCVEPAPLVETKAMQERLMTKMEEVVVEDMAAT